VRFWDVLKEVSPDAIRREADRLFVLALAGNPDDVAAARAEILGRGSSPDEIRAAQPYIFSASPPYSPEEETRLRHADLLVSLPGGPGLTDFRPADTVQVELVEDVGLRVLERRPDLRVAMSRRLLGLRELAAEQVVRDYSRANAEFAAVAGVSQSIPLLAPLFPAGLLADVVVLTKNQVLMIFRLAAIYGEDLSLKARSKEITAVVGGAFGWRTLARGIAGVVPGGLGLPIRAGIAFSGTYAVGRAAQMVFDEGRRPTRQEMLQIYADARKLAADAVDVIKDRFARRKKAPEEQKALPEPAEDFATVPRESVPVDRSES
jgi:uncharacterized protein (DUF697 family)